MFGLSLVSRIAGFVVEQIVEMNPSAMVGLACFVVSVIVCGWSWYVKPRNETRQTVVRLVKMIEAERKKGPPSSEKHTKAIKKLETILRSTTSSKADANAYLRKVTKRPSISLGSLKKVE